MYVYAINTFCDNTIQFILVNNVILFVTICNNMDNIPMYKVLKIHFNEIISFNQYIMLIYTIIPLSIRYRIMPSASMDLLYN